MTDDPSAAVRFTARPSASDVMWTSAALVRESGVALAVGGYITSLSIIGFVRFADVVNLVMIALGATFLTGLFVVPFAWFSISRRRDLVLAPMEVEADQEGLTVTTPIASSRQAWSVYKRVRETSRAFLLDTGMGANAVIAKRAVAPADLERFRALLGRVGLFGRDGDRLPTRIIWLSVGICLGVGFSIAMPLIL